jgi:hypothetical protein
MHITLPYELTQQIKSAAEFLSIEPIALIELLVEDGLSLYDQSPDEFRTSIDPQPEANPQLPIQS